MKVRQEKKETEAKVDFFINTAHDLLTPLNLIKAPLEDLKKGNMEEQNSQLLDIALNNSEKLSLYVEKLLDFQRISLNASRLVLTKQELESFIRYKIDAFRIVTNHKYISIKCDLDQSTHQPVWFDKEKLTQIINNLISNAVKYTPYGGEICISAVVKDNSWELHIKDTGIGISNRDQKMIFKYIYRAENAINSEELGSGIGLRLVSTLTGIHKGTIGFKSKLGKGTEFDLSFPLHYKNMPKDASVSDASDQEQYEQTLLEKKMQLIMIVEDDEEMAHYLKMSLKSNYAVRLCRNGIEALNLINSVYPQLIISDFIMPEMNGMELCQKLKSNPQTSHIPFILLTGVTDSKSVLEGMKAKADDYIKKPFDKELLLTKIANMLELQKARQRRTIEELKNENAIELSNKADTEFMNKLVELIKSNIDNADLSIPFLCQQMALSRTLLYNKITQLTGNSPTEFIRIIRLRHAANLLLTGKYSVSDVSLEIGIDNPKYFSRIFKEFFGVSPKDYIAK